MSADDNVTISSLHRFFVDNKCIENDRVLIESAEAKQIFSVLRLREGDKIAVLDGTGSAYIVQITEARSAKIEGEIVEKTAIDTESRIKISLAQSLPKGDKLEFIIQKGTELGVEKFLLMKTARTVARPADDKVSRKVERWQAIAKEAAEQSGRAIIPEVSGIFSLEELVSRIEKYDMTVCLWEEENQTSLKEVLNQNRSAEKILLIIGPEGGLEEREVDILKANGVQTASLGKRILRCETAAIVTVADVLYELEM